jgi:hypothetical protein
MYIHLNNEKVGVKMYNNLSGNNLDTWCHVDL